jgi:putative ATP-dependent endonuclease of OLD family
MITPETVIPDYILDAIFQAHLPVSIQTWARVLDYRVSVLAESQLYAAVEIDAMRAQIRRYYSGEIDFAGVRAEMLQAFPADGINTILAGF